MENISANEIKRQASALKSKAEYIGKTRFDLVYCMECLSDCVSSDDSNLGQNLFNLANLFEQTYDMANKAFARVADIMDNYAMNAIQNEENLATDVKSSQSAVEQINSELPEIYVNWE